MTKLDLKKIKKGIFLVNVLGIVFDTSSRKILIGKREKDPYVPKLTWSFPGGTPVYGEDLEKSIEKQIKEKTGLKNNENNLTKEKLTLKEVQKSAWKLILKQPAEAIKILIAYEDPDNEEIKFLLKTAIDRLDKFGSGKKQEENIDAAVEEEFNNEAQEDNEVADNLLELKIKEKNLDGARMSMRQHEDKDDGMERALKESLAKSESETETELIKDFYGDSGDFILDEEGKGEEMTSLNMEEGLEDEERRAAKRETYYKQNKLVNKQGFTHVGFEDDAGREIKFTEAEKMHEEAKDEFVKEQTEEILDTLSQKTPDANFFDIQNRARAKRKVEQLTNKNAEEIIKLPS